MKYKFIQFSTLLFLFFTTQALSNPINKINLIGLNLTSESSLLKLLPFEIGQKFSPDASDKIIKSLFETGLFSDIRIIKNENSLNITLEENPQIKFIDLKVESKSSFSAWLRNQEELISNVEFIKYTSDNKLAVGDFFTEQKLSKFILFLETKYSESGYFNVEINPVLDIDLQNRIGIDFQISQGNRASIESLKVSGNKAFTSKNLLKSFTIGEPDMMIVNYFTNKDQFSDLSFRKGLDAMTQKYFSSGYLDFKIVNVDTNFNESKDKIFIDINVSEGIQYKLGEVTFEGELGNQSLSDLSSVITMKTGDVFNRSLIMSNIQNLTDVFSDQGYAFVAIDPITSDFLDSVNIKFVISLNKKVYINRITISGNTRTQDSVIRREISLNEGGLFSSSKLRNSIKKLRRLGYFSDVKMDATTVKDAQDKIDLNFTVEETKTGAISLSISQSNNYGVALGAGIKENNIFGSGNTLNTELKFSESFNRLSFYFENPNYNKEGNSISFGAFMSEINDDDIMKDSYEINTKGINVGYGIPITENTRINTSLEFSKNTVKCGTTFSNSGYELSQCLERINNELKLNANWKENTLNNYLNPTDGKSNSVSVGIAIPGGDYRYFNVNANHTSYSPVNNNLTLKLTGSIDLAKGYSNKKLPFFKRYFGGGSGSVRGFGNKTLGPLYANNKAKGGELSILGSANLIFPAFFFDDNENMRMSAFIDAGNIYEKTSNIKLNDLRMSTGVGFAYLSPIGAIGMFWSTPILKKSGDTIESFGFSLGTGF